jgi:hypothetical protein
MVVGESLYVRNGKIFGPLYLIWANVPKGIPLKGLTMISVIAKRIASGQLTKSNVTTADLVNVLLMQKVLQKLLREDMQLHIIRLTGKYTLVYSTVR